VSYTISPWRCTLRCDWPGCDHTLVGEEYVSVRDLRRQASWDGPQCRPWLCGHYLALRPGDQARALDLCPEHARARADLFAQARAQRLAATEERRAVQQADRAARRLERLLRSSS
jgi:hypothetical protein